MMKTVLLAALFLCLICSYGYAQEENQTNNDTNASYMPPEYKKLLFGETALQYQQSLDEKQNALDREELQRARSDEASFEPVEDMDRFQDTWDYGGVVEGKVIEHQFEFVNESEAILTIRQVDTSCSCTTASVPEKVLAPGASTTVNVRVDTKGEAGPLKQYVYVNTDNPAEPVHVFTIKANVNKLVKGG
jgi:hypothetical protein